ncbi:MAG: hypothetical protein IJ760_03470 [Bacteroidales bacterium]|nr:hypothetical protein [Bacteroidales bacterium]
MRRAATLLTIMMLLLAASATAQSPARSWKRGPLTKKDFGAVPTRGSDRNSHLHYGIVYNTSGVGDGLNSYIFCKTAAVMFPADSWLADGHADEREMNYNQAVFDLVEVHSRQMQREAQMLNRGRQYDFLLAATLDRLEREIRALDAATGHGQDSLALERMRQQNRRWLAENPATRPNFEREGWWWLFDLGLGACVNGMELGKWIGPSIGLIDYELATGYKRLEFSLHFTQANSKLRENADYEDWPTGEVWNREEIHARLGFSVIDKPTYSLTPFVGAGFTSFFEPYMGEYYSVALMPTITLGVTGRRHIHHWHYVTNGLKHRADRVTSSVSASLYGSYSTNSFFPLLASGHFPMLTFGLRLGVSLRTERETVTWP